ncbi:hypothetical protein [Aquirufa antheringensis]
MTNLSHLAYIDPGAGSLLFQVILSGLLTFVVFYKKVILFIKYLFKKKGK